MILLNSSVEADDQASPKHVDWAASVAHGSQMAFQQAL